MEEKQRKILFFMASLRGGGAEKNLIDVLTRFDYTKYKVTLGLLFFRGEYINKIPKSVHTISLLPKNSFLLRIAYKFFFDLPLKYNYEWLTRIFVNFILPKHYDSEIAYMEGLATKCISYHSSKAKKTAWIHTDLFFNHYTDNLFRKDQEKTVYASFEQLIFVSNGAYSGFRALFGETPVTQQVLYNLIPKHEIIDKSKEFVPSFGRKNLTIVTVGRLEPQKRYDRLIRVALRCKNEGLSIRFLIVGQGILLEEYLQFVQINDLQNYVEFVGFQSNPYPYILMADVFINTSLTEGYPLVICEALCLGKPVIATRCTGNLDLLGENEYGLIVEQNDDSIFEGVKKYYTDRNLLDHYSKKAKFRASMFDENQVLNQIYTHI